LSVSSFRQRDLKICGYVLVQFPNPPLWVALAALLLARLTDEASTMHDLARAAFLRRTHSPGI
jgi:hypothetical protein